MLMRLYALDARIQRLARQEHIRRTGLAAQRARLGRRLRAALASPAALAVAAGAGFLCARIAGGRTRAESGAASRSARRASSWVSSVLTRVVVPGLISWWWETRSSAGTERR